MSDPRLAKSGRGIDHSPARATNFRVFISRFPNIAFYTTDSMVPAVNVPEVLLEYSSGPAFLNDNKVEFEVFTLGFIVDELFESYQEVFEYFMDVASPVENRKKIIEPIDIHIQALDNNKNPIITFTLTEAIPTALGQITYDTQDEGNTQLVCDITFRYDRMKMTRKSIDIPTGLDNVNERIE